MALANKYGNVPDVSQSIQNHRKNIRKYKPRPKGFRIARMKVGFKSSWIRSGYMVSCSTPWNYYSSIAKGYDELYGAEQRKKVKLIIEMLHPVSSWKVLDIGCGTGVSMECWPCSIEGIEPSKKMAEIAKAKGFKIMVGSAEQLPFRDNSFDAVIAVTSAHHFSSDAFKEMARVAPRAALSVLKKSSARVKRMVKKYWKITTLKESGPDVIICCGQSLKRSPSRVDPKIV